MSNRDRGNLLGILDAIGKIQQYVRGISTPKEYFDSPMAFDATLMNFVVIGEMADRLSTELKDRYSKRVDWQRIKDFRNLVAHDYLGVDAEEVWQIINSDLPALRTELTRILKETTST